MSIIYHRQGTLFPPHLNSDWTGWSDKCKESSIIIRLHTLNLTRKREANNYDWSSFISRRSTQAKETLTCHNIALYCKEKWIMKRRRRRRRKRCQLKYKVCVLSRVELTKKILGALTKGGQSIKNSFKIIDIFHRFKNLWCLKCANKGGSKKQEIFQT